MRPFVHLHTHSEYSLLDGFSRINDLVAKAKANNMPALAITDHGNMFGAIRLYNACRKAGIKPILGCELYVTPGEMTEPSPAGTKDKKTNYHLVLLAKNQTGYENLCRLVSQSYEHGFHGRPRVDKKCLATHSDGLICLTACLGGEVPQRLLHEGPEAALAAAKWLRDTYGPENFFIEIQNHFQPKNEQVIPALVDIAEKLGVEVVATNDSHYTHQSDWEAHDVLICIQTNSAKSDPDRWRFPPGGHHYFKNGDEMAAAMQGYEYAVDNTIKIADMIDLELKEEYQLPLFDIPENHTINSYFVEVVNQGFEERRRTVLEPLEAKGTLRKPWPDYYDRLKQEIDVINDMGFPGYFLITWDFIRKAKEMGVPVGPGRGSAAGSLVAYSLQITDVDPLQYDLLFERFLNQERVTMPDVDIDFCQDRRGEVIDYVTEKYGRKNVCQIVTYGTMKARMVIKDVGRALGFSPAETNKIAKLVPEDLGITLTKALEQSPDFRDLFERDPRAKELIELSIKLEGLSRNTGVHAAGVIIAPGDVTDWAPLYRDPKKGTVCVQYAKDEAEQIGLLKMDFLGLKTLTVISTTLEIIKTTTGEEVDLNTITDFNDEKTYGLFCRGETDGVFQFESDGMKNLLIRLGPKRFEDFIALNALYRPGPLGSGMVDTFIEGAHGAESTYELDVLEDILAETYGVILYQEQVMKIAQVVGGFSLAEADLLRRAMGKKKEEIMVQKKKEFLAGAAKQNYPEKVCAGLFDKMAEFAKYGFNKSHSAAYALVAYQTAYLKANYPVQFMAALLTLDKDNTDKVVNYVDKIRGANIEILPPDINKSWDKFTVEGQAIRFALGAIKGIGDAALESIMVTKRETEIDSFKAFFEKVDLRKINKKVVEQLVKSGAFDFTGHTRKGMYAAIEELLAWGSKMQKEALGGQTNLFGERIAEQCAVVIDRDAWDAREKLIYEKETLGIYISGHPLDIYRQLLDKHTSCHTRDLEHMSEGSEAIIGGQVVTSRKITTKKGDLMAFMTLEDYQGMAEFTIFPRTYNKVREMLESGRMLIVKGEVQFRNEKVNVLVQEIHDLATWSRNKVRSCVFRFRTQDVDDDKLQRLYDHLEVNRGKCEVYFEVDVDDKYRTIIRANHKIDPGHALSQFTTNNPVFKTLLRY